MRNKRSEEDPRIRPTPHSPSPAPVSPAPALASVSPRLEPSRAAGPSAVLGKSMIVRGEIHSKEDLTIDGQVEGSIDVPEHRLTVGATGRVEVNTIRAREV